MNYRALLVLGVVVIAGCSSGPTGPAAPADGPASQTDATGSPTDGTTSATPTRTPTPPSSTSTPTGTDTPTPTETPRPPSSATPTHGTPTDGVYNAFYFRAERVSLAEIGYDLAAHVGDLDPRSRRLVESALANGSATATVHCGSATADCGPLADTRYLREDKQFYRVNATVVGSAERTGYRFEVHGELPEYRDDYDTARREAVPYESLSPARKAAFERLFTHRGTIEGLVGERLYVPAGERAANATGWLDGDPHYVRYDGAFYRVQYTGETERRVRVRVEYRLRRVADSGAAFARSRLDGLVTNVTDDRPPAPARSVVLAAVQRGSFEWEGTVSTRPERVVAAARWIRERGPRPHLAYVRHEGEFYRVEFREVIE